MKHLLRYAGILALVVILTPAGIPQAPQTPRPQRFPPLADDGPSAPPEHKPQQDEILKADHEQDLKDAAHLLALAEELKKDLEKNDRHVLSIATVKKVDEIEKLAKHIRGRIVR